MPQQVPRLLAVFAIAIGALVVGRHLLIPETFGDLGHFRAAAVDSIAARPVKYAAGSSAPSAIGRWLTGTPAATTPA